MSEGKARESQKAMGLETTLTETMATTTSHHGSLVKPTAESANKHHPNPASCKKTHTCEQSQKYKEWLKQQNEKQWTQQSLLKTAPTAGHRTNPQQQHPQQAQQQQIASGVSVAAAQHQQPTQATAKINSALIVLVASSTLWRCCCSDVLNGVQQKKALVH